VRFEGDRMIVELLDGRSIEVSLAQFPRLLRASAGERAEVRISPRGLHWDKLDEDISIAGLLAGRGGRLVKPSLHGSG
jgi:hypothetical protein